MTGGPPAAGGAAVDVGRQVRRSRWRSKTEPDHRRGRARQLVGVWTERPGGTGAEAVCDGVEGAGVPLPLRDTASATAAANTRTAATATDRTSQGSGRPSGGGAGGRDGGSAGQGRRRLDPGAKQRRVRARRTMRGRAAPRSPSPPGHVAPVCPGPDRPRTRPSSILRVGIVPDSGTVHAQLGPPGAGGIVQWLGRQTKPPPDTPVGLTPPQEESCDPISRWARPHRRATGLPATPVRVPDAVRRGLIAHVLLREASAAGAARIPRRDRTRARRSARQAADAARTGVTCRIVVCDGDETGQELLDEALRVLDPDVLGFDLELIRFDLSLENRRPRPTPWCTTPQRPCARPGSDSRPPRSPRRPRVT